VNLRLNHRIRVPADNFSDDGLSSRTIVIKYYDYVRNLWRMTSELYGFGYVGECPQK
jgi:hypothetical protein